MYAASLFLIDLSISALVISLYGKFCPAAMIMPLTACPKIKEGHGPGPHGGTALRAMACALEESGGGFSVCASLTAVFGNDGGPPTMAGSRSP